MSTMEAVNKTMDENYSKVMKDDSDEGFTSVVYIEDICPTTYDRVFLPIEVNEMDFEDEMVKLEFVNQDCTVENWDGDREEIRTSFSHFDPTSNTEIIEENSTELFEAPPDGFVITEVRPAQVKTVAKPSVRSPSKSVIRSPMKPSAKPPDVLIENQSDETNQKMKFCKIQCTICKKWFLNDTIVMHLLTHSGESGIDFYCLICQQAFDDEASLNNHLPVHLNDNSNNIIFRGDEIMKFIEQRKQQTNEEIKFVEEAEVEAEEPEIEAEEVQEVEEEIPEEETEQEQSEIILQILKCDICNIYFEDEESMADHSKEHTMKLTHDDKPFACSICYKSYKRKSELVRHSMVHTDERPYECLECSMTFKEKAKLKNHILIHTGQFDCNVCGKVFSRKTDLKRHGLIHTRDDLTKVNSIGKKPLIQPERHQCCICNKIFKQKATLNSHLITYHPDEGLFQCDSCLKTFKNESALQKHELCHS